MILGSSDGHGKLKACQMNELDRFRGSLLGLACGDAISATDEFKSRGTFSAPTEMMGGGPIEFQPGEWTDDTSMALCLATSLVEPKGFNARDQMDVNEGNFMLTLNSGTILVFNSNRMGGCLLRVIQF